MRFRISSKFSPRAKSNRSASRRRNSLRTRCPTATTDSSRSRTTSGLEMLRLRDFHFAISQKPLRRQDRNGFHGSVRGAIHRPGWRVSRELKQVLVLVDEFAGDDGGYRTAFEAVAVEGRVAGLASGLL